MQPFVVFAFESVSVLRLEGVATKMKPSARHDSTVSVSKAAFELLKNPLVSVKCVHPSRSSRYTEGSADREILAN